MDVNRGSAVDLQRDVMLGADLDALAIRQQSQREAYGKEIEAYDEGQQAAINRQTAASARRIAGVNIAGLQKVRDVTRKGRLSTKAANIKAIEENLDAGARLLADGSGAVDGAGRRGDLRREMVHERA